ncbi:MAG: hypothetical protein ACUVWW_12215, partial [Anaerolineae bacterium]
MDWEDAPFSFAARGLEILTRENHGQHCQDKQTRVKRDIEINLVEVGERSVKHKPNDQPENDAMPCPSFLLFDGIMSDVS